MNIFKRAYLSFQARVVRPYMMKNYEKTKYGRKLKKLKDIHKGERCFIIGNGPSLRAEDLEALHNAGIPCFATNNILKMFENTSWRPDFYVCEDLLVLEDLKNRLNQINFKYKFIPLNYKWYNDIHIENATYFFQSFQPNDDEYYVFSDNCSEKISCSGTVTITCMQLAAYMGFKEIYLLGIDHNYRVTQDNSGNIITDSSVKDYFDNDYANTMKNKNIPNLGKTTMAYESAKVFFGNMNVNIYNATRGGKLEVYPRVNFDEAVKGNLI